MSSYMWLIGSRVYMLSACYSVISLVFTCVLIYSVPLTKVNSVRCVGKTLSYAAPVLFHKTSYWMKVRDIIRVDYSNMSTFFCCLAITSAEMPLVIESLHTGPVCDQAANGFSISTKCSFI